MTEQKRQPHQATTPTSSPSHPAPQSSPASTAGSSAESNPDRKHHNITVPPRTEVEVAPGTTIFLHRDHPTDITIHHSAEVSGLLADWTPEGTPAPESSED